MINAKHMKKFWDKVNKCEECWIWTGARTSDDYGSFRSQGKLWTAHRFSWSIHNGEIPQGKWVLHKCDNPPCVNPSHLFLGDAKSNVIDRDFKGRGKIMSGESHGRAKLKNEDVFKIREMYKQGKTNCYLSKLFKVESSVITRIVQGKTWRHILPRQEEVSCHALQEAIDKFTSECRPMTPEEHALMREFLRTHYPYHSEP